MAIRLRKRLAAGANNDMGLTRYKQHSVFQSRGLCTCFRLCGRLEVNCFEDKKKTYEYKETGDNNKITGRKNEV
jgi:hypothetical protein